MERIFSVYTEAMLVRASELVLYWHHLLILQIVKIVYLVLFIR